MKKNNVTKRSFDDQRIASSNKEQSVGVTTYDAFEERKTGSKTYNVDHNQEGGTYASSKYDTINHNQERGAYSSSKYSSRTPIFTDKVQTSVKHSGGSSAYEVKL